MFKFLILQTKKKEECIVVSKTIVEQWGPNYKIVSTLPALSDSQC